MLPLIYVLYVCATFIDSRGYARYLTCIHFYSSAGGKRKLHDLWEQRKCACEGKVLRARLRFSKLHHPHRWTITWKKHHPNHYHFTKSTTSPSTPPCSSKGIFATYRHPHRWQPILRRRWMALLLHTVVNGWLTNVIVIHFIYIHSPCFFRFPRLFSRYMRIQLLAIEINLLIIIMWYDT